jgi:hypothetical protein
MFTIGGTGVLCHKYLGPNAQGTQIATSAAQTAASNVIPMSNTLPINIGDTVTGNNIPANSSVLAKDASTITISNNTTAPLPSGTIIGISQNAAIPSYTNQSAQNIQDMLFLENRDRKYDTSVYKMRGIYTVTDNDFDLTQFGLFLSSGTLFMEFHLNDMVDILGRRIMNGDVLELQHLLDYNPLDETLPVALKRFFVVGDCSRATDGYSPTWWPHLWRCKLNPLVDSQEYKDILNSISAGGNTTLANVISTFNQTISINDSIIASAIQDVPLSGYDTSHIYVKPLDPEGNIIAGDADTADDAIVDGSSVSATADEGLLTPDAKVEGYLTGDGQAPNGLPVYAGISFPNTPRIGDFALRTDYLPNRLFRFDGFRWVKIEDMTRATLGNNSNTQLGTFVNDTASFTDAAGTHTEQQSLSKAFTPKADF